MRKQSSILLILLIGSSLSHYKTYKGSSFNNNYAVKQSPAVYVGGSGSLSSKILPQTSNPFISNMASNTTTTTTTTQVKLPNYTAVQAPEPEPIVVPVHHHGHHHHGHHHHHHSPAPVPAPAPVVAPLSIVPAATPAIPHVHSGHPYIAPAVAPQNMTHQQLIEYLASNQGASLGATLANKSGIILKKCNAYCNTLPESPVCDSANVLYRNKCAAKCIQKTASTENLRYGMCCCSDDDFKYDDDNMSFFSSGNARLCMSPCIFNCLGGEDRIEDEHNDDYTDFEMSDLTNACPLVV